VTNIGKRLNPTAEQIDQADSSAVPTCARASHLMTRAASAARLLKPSLTIRH
jgi:hypothetical protein